MDQEKQIREDSEVINSFSSILKPLAVIVSGVVLIGILIVKVNAGSDEKELLSFDQIGKNASTSAEQPQVQGVQAGPIGPIKPSTSPTASASPSLSPTSTSTPTPTSAPTSTPTPTPEPTNSPTNSPTPTPTETVSPTVTPTGTLSPTP